jgi:hypothetical protein
LSEISSIGTLLCYDAFEELRHDSFLRNGFELPLNWKDGGFETFSHFNDKDGLRERRSFSVCVCFVMALSAQTLGRGRRAFSLQFHGWYGRDMGHISLLALVSPAVGVFKDPGRSQIWHRDG